MLATSLATSSPRVTDFDIDGFSGVLGTNIAPNSGENQGMSLSSLVDSGTPTPESSKSFTVAEGISCIIGGVGNWQNGEMSNVSMWIEDPFGTIINATTDPTATSPNAQANLFLVPHSAGDGTILTFVLLTPTAGTWKVGLNYDASVDTPPFQLSVTTVPAGGFKEMSQAYKSMYDQKHPPTDSIGGDTSWSCICCTVAAYGLALTVTVLGTALAGLLTTSAIVAAFASFFSCTPAVALAWLIGLTAIEAGVVLTVDFVLNEMCTWGEACKS